MSQTHPPQNGNLIRLGPSLPKQNHEAWASLQQVLDALPDPAWVLSADGEVRLVNAAACRIYGHELREWQTATFLRAVGLGRRAFDQLVSLLHEEDYQYVEGEHRRRNGSRFPAELRLHPLLIQGASAVLVLGRDNSERKSAESAFREMQARFRQTFEHAGSGMALVLPEGFFLQVNEAFSKLAGYSRHELQQLNLKDLLHPDDAVRAFGGLEGCRSGGKEPLNLDLRFVRPDGSLVWGELSATWFSAEDDKTEYWIVLVQDITSRRQAEEALAASEERYRQVVHRVRDVLFQLDDEIRFVFLNPAWEKLTGLECGKSLGRRLTEFVTENQRDSLQNLCVSLREGERQVCEGEFFFEFTPGHDRWLRVTLMGDGCGTVTGTLHDIQEQKVDKDRLLDERQFLQAVIDGVCDPLLVVGLDHRVQLMNKAARRNATMLLVDGHHPFCYQLHLGRRQPCSGDYHPCPMAEVRTTGQPVTVVHYRDEKEGGQRVYEVQASPFRDADGRLSGIIESFRDITYLFEAEEQLQEKESRLDYLVQHDLLTGLPNRNLFLVRLRRMISRAMQSGKKLGVLLLDLDRFKNINDSLGHDIGDLVLCEVAKRLTTTLRDSDVVARLGGDEFIVVLDSLSAAEHVEAVARKILAALTPQLEIRDCQLFLTGSLGISLFPDDGGEPKELLKAADTALFRAKQAGRNSFSFYTPDMNARSKELLLLEASFRQAIEEEQLVLHFQPQIDLFTGHVRGVEALVRWEHPEKGMISPGDFIPLAEETGLIVPMGEWVLRQACRHAVRWRDLGFAPIRMTVNISARQFLKERLIETVLGILAETGLEPDDLELEITESMIMHDIERATGIMNRIAETGIHLAIDDFGTGYSSLAHLKRFPLTTLKIDRAFVKDIGSNLEDEAIIKAIIALAHSLDLQVVAEGIETMEQYGFLKENGCEQGQGFLFSRPVPADRISPLLRPRPLF
ncbi:PAS domain S-box-containing protein/diguanylate cyclase (GGDEF)-like protein [Geothermobacter ehrlichii]|uniref:PAS domain S-box-containing protein/diguanylate cyclase (GGDEF)-like protein n=1 Tax=Geothermobacter ehrlichii TaxID=213224 RepID=A0A5D3WRS9_9BACT|nr:EAL domain-containing protein [Geothermobacter ehrlichii]TYP00299.1 PAS domain S-box-containing protein/diguanylate cyclase (GGDEF)-like protein [Geothermobacter ehrlichii]